MRMTETHTPIVSWSALSEGDNLIWHHMSRAEQLAALQDMANRPEASQPTETTVADVLTRVRAKRTQPHLYE